VKMSKKKNPLSDKLTQPSTDHPMEPSEPIDPMIKMLFDQLEAFGSSTTTDTVVNEEQTLPQSKFLPLTPTQGGVAKKPTAPKEARPKETVQKEAQQKAVSKKSVPKKAQRKEAARKVAMTTSNVGVLKPKTTKLPSSAVSHQVSSKTFFHGICSTAK
jgi:hypothetical protein